VRSCVRACVHACVRAFVRACVRACVRAGVRLLLVIYVRRMVPSGSHSVTGGRVFVIGIFLGVIFTVVTCCYTIDVYTEFFYTFNTDTAIFPNQLYRQQSNFRITTFFVCLGVGFFTCLLSLYISI
jgi:hypothetical protein